MSPKDMAPSVSLDDLKREYLELDSKLFVTAAEVYWRQGQLLEQIKASPEVPHGKWLPWIEKNINIKSNVVAMRLKIAKLPEPHKFLTHEKFQLRELAQIADIATKQKLSIDKAAQRWRQKAPKPKTKSDPKPKPKPRPKDAQGHFDSVRVDVPESMKKKFDRLVREMEMAFFARVEDQVERRLGQRLIEIRKREEEVRLKEQAQKDALRDISKVMPIADFKFIATCLHPDKPDRDTARLTKAYQLFMNLEGYVDLTVGIRKLRERGTGWERMHPRYSASAKVNAKATKH